MPQLTEEDLKSMSPEQIAELQKQNCIFCHIISGKVASKKVYDDEKVVALLDINPANPGHVLLLPKEHYAIMPLIPQDVLGHLFMVAKGISHACLKAFRAQGTNIFVANGVVAGQRAQHFMVHVIPRKENDSISVFNIKHKDIDERQLEELRRLIKAKVDQMFGLKQEVMDLDRLKKTGGAEERIEGLLKEEEEEKNEKETAGAEKKESPKEEKDKEEEVEGEIDIDKIADMFK